MAELTPIPLGTLLRRAFHEYHHQAAIFDLPKTKFFLGFDDVDLSVHHNGRRAATPLGPAAGPHGQMAQNIILCWLGGCRIIELKTVQILDELTVSRPCIDVTSVGYNVEWSQELKLEQSLREYTGAMMFLEILKSSQLLRDRLPACWGDTLFDMSVGYNLEGIRSSRITQWIHAMKNATPVIDELRSQLTGTWARYRDLPFPTRVSDSITLSTFHGCPANEIEAIVEHLLGEMDLHVCVKMNPTLLGQEAIEHLLHDVLGYRDIQLHPPAFENDLQFDEALDLVPRLQRAAHRAGKTLSLKFSNTLVVKNHRKVFPDEVMYLSGPPLHVLALHLVERFRRDLEHAIPMSFAAGLNAQNVAGAVAMNFVPVTTCTDLLKAGGYARLLPYLENLRTSMREAGARTIPEFILYHDGQTTQKVQEAAANPRYAAARNQGAPRKIGSTLSTFDCINCDKCVPGCPNDANFIYETVAQEIRYSNLNLVPGGAIHPVDGGVFRVIKTHQLANYADACNECGNCAVLCPEEGGPYLSKPRFFSSLKTWLRDARGNGYHLEYASGQQTIYGTIGAKSYQLTLDPGADRAWFADGDATIEVRLSSAEPLYWSGTATGVIDMQPYFQLKMLAESVGNPQRANFANANALNNEFAGV